MGIKMTWDLASTLILGFQDGIERVHGDRAAIEEKLREDPGLIKTCLEEMEKYPDKDPEMIAYSAAYHAAMKIQDKVGA
jgi:hypothetical protein